MKYRVYMPDSRGLVAEYNDEPFKFPMSTWIQSRPKVKM